MSDFKHYYELCKKEMQELRNKSRCLVTVYDEILDRNPGDDLTRIMRNQEYGKAKGLTMALIVLADKMYEIVEQEGR